MKKRVFSLLLVIGLLFTCLLSCAGTPEDASSEEESSVVASSTTESTTGTTADDGAQSTTTTVESTAVTEDATTVTSTTATVQTTTVTKATTTTTTKKPTTTTTTVVEEKSWYTPGAITLTKSEVDQILSQTYKKPKNIIYMIGDGMGPNDITLSEKFSNECFPFGLVLNQLPFSGLAETRSANNVVTDSAASGTALATGVKTNNGFVGKTPDGEDIQNLGEIARSQNKKVGIVTNDYIVGATPSAFCVHNTDRNNYAELTDSMIGFMPDVLIGQHPPVNLMESLSTENASKLGKILFPDSFSEINSMLNTDPKCAKSLLYFLDAPSMEEAEDTLAYCTEIALNRLKNKNGFFLMVENAVTDKAGHNNIINGKVNGVVTLDRAIAVALKFMKENPDTLLIVTSDHETGGVMLPSEGVTPTNALFTTEGHTEADVRVFAAGYGAQYFKNRTLDNTDIGKFVIKAVQGKIY